MRQHCPRARATPTEAALFCAEWASGRCEYALSGRIAATAHTELGGYDVVAVLDTATLTAEAIGNLGTVPCFGYCVSPRA